MLGEAKATTTLTAEPGGWSVGTVPCRSGGWEAFTNNQSTSGSVAIKVTTSPALFR